VADATQPAGTVADALEALLREEHATLQALAQIIEDEHAVLLGQDSQALEEVTARKRHAAEAHAAQQQRRLAFMRDQRLPTDTGLGDLPTVREGPAALRERQRELAALAQACFENNRRNGALILRLQERTRGALDVLRREESSELYSLSGAREHSSDSRSLGKA
jgi:flagellar biosynthesis/type III secretory pathway chaperone